MRKKATFVLAMVCVMAAVNFASADTIRGIGMDFVTIGNPGNTADTGGTPGCGAVSYGYRIGKYEVTNAQWNACTAAVGAPTGNYVPGDHNLSAAYTGSQQPTNNVSWYEALQFCNYLTSGDKSKGVYQFSGDNINPGDFIGIDRDAAKVSYGTTYFLPTEDEWYKAAYYKPDGSGYSLYANGINTAPSTSQACYDIYSSPWNIGAGTQEQNGTFDMMGNVWEWNESPIYGSDRVIRGGSFYAGPHVDHLASSYRRILTPGECYDIGFRVASVPEPASAILIGAGCLFARLRQRKH